MTLHLCPLREPCSPLGPQGPAVWASMSCPRLSLLRSFVCTFTLFILEDMILLLRQTAVHAVSFPLITNCSLPYPEELYTGLPLELME